MSCSTCKKVVVVEPGKHGLQYSVVPDVTTVEGKMGRRYAINTPLIPRPHSPRGGWSVTLYLHGQATVITGASASAVFIAASDFLVLNEISHTLLDLWFNLNIQWVTNAIDKYQQVPLASLLDVAITNY